jgi:hypothetical protein
MLAMLADPLNHSELWWKPELAEVLEEDICQTVEEAIQKFLDARTNCTPRMRYVDQRFAILGRAVLVLQLSNGAQSCQQERTLPAIQHNCIMIHRITVQFPRIGEGYLFTVYLKKTYATIKPI